MYDRPATLIEKQKNHVVIIVANDGMLFYLVVEVVYSRERDELTGVQIKIEDLTLNLEGSVVRCLLFFGLLGLV